MEKAASNYAELRHQDFSLVAACQMLKASFDRNTSKASANLAKTPVCFLKLTWMLVDLLDMIGCRVSFPVLEV